MREIITATKTTIVHEDQSTWPPVSENLIFFVDDKEKSVLIGRLDELECHNVITQEEHNYLFNRVMDRHQIIHYSLSPLERHCEVQAITAWMGPNDFLTK